MRIKNISKRNYVHTYLDEKANLQMLILKPGQNMEVEDKIAKSWLKSKDVIEYVDPELAKKEKEKLEAENAKLKAELEAQKETKKASKPKTVKSTKTKKNQK